MAAETQDRKTGKGTDMQKIGIIGAMDIEVNTLKGMLKTDKEITKAGMTFCEGTLEGKQVVIVKCGVGKVNAAMCVQILADLFEVTHIINTGVAGSLNAKLDIGDILVSVDALQHDMDVTALGYQPGQNPDFKQVEFKADTAMGRCAMVACRKVNPDIAVMEGRVVSGDVFVNSADLKERLVSVFHGDCAEMEGASIAQASWLNGLPFLILRAISDKADNSSHMDYPTFEKQAAEHCARLVREFVATF